MKKGEKSNKIEEKKIRTNIKKTKQNEMKTRSLMNEQKWKEVKIGRNIRAIKE